VPGRPTRRGRGFRLDSTLRPREVDLAVEVDPARGRGFRGRVAISLENRRRRRFVELHAADLRLSGARLRTADGRTLAGSIEMHPERETARIHLPETFGPGGGLLELSFRGRLREDLRGLYAARAGDRHYALSQLEAADARRFFPCFDEPAMKARFRITVETAASNRVLSNAPVEAEEPLPGGRRRTRFRPTPPLSTYLVALAVGEFEVSRTVQAGRTPIRVWHVPGKGALCDFALETAAACLERLERYFDLPHPYEKLDLLAAPDFEAGAMENAGAVFFRETLLLLDPETASLPERKRAAEVICHELAHMWYGNLVTMAWWDDLWLNEAFATWMAFAIVDSWKPGWRMWHDFDHARSAALDLDALRNTHAIYAPVRNADEATENFDLITYEKGAAVVRMLERFLGPARFRRGVRRYLRRHAESNATAADLWRALSEVSGEDVARIARAWVETPGFPLLRLTRHRRGGGTGLSLRQERFLARPARTPSRLRWPIPVVALLGRRRGRPARLRVLLDRNSARVPLPDGEPTFVYGNAEEGGFYRVAHAPEEVRRLAAHRHALSPLERMGLVRHQWACLRADRAELETFLDLVRSFGAEEDPDVLQALHGPLGFLDAQVARAAGVRPAFRRLVVEALGEQLLELSWDPAPGEDDETRLRRAAVIALLGGVAEWEPVLAAASERALAYLADRRSLDANLADATVWLAARRGGRGLFDRYLEESRSAPTPQERRRFRMGLAEFRSEREIRRALRLTLSRDLPTQDVAPFLARLLRNEAARERAWEYLVAHWSRLSRRIPPMLVTHVLDATPALATRRHRMEVARFFREHPVPTGIRALRQALERFDLDAALRRRAVPALRRYLAGAHPGGAA